MSTIRAAASPAESRLSHLIPLNPGESAQLVGEQPSAAVRADTELFWSCRAEMPVGVGRHQVGAQNQTVSGSLLACIAWPSPRSSRRTRRCVLFCAAPIPFHGRSGTDEAVPARHFDQPGGAGVIVREHVRKARRLSGPVSCGGAAGTYKEPRPPALTPTSTSGGRTSRPEPWHRRSHLIPANPASTLILPDVARGAGSRPR